MEAPVTLVTAGAESADELTGRDYREIYDELRSKTTLRQFAEFIGSKVSFAWWSKYERGEAQLDRERRIELRRAVGLAVLPRTVAEVTAEVDPDATVYQVGEGQADRVVLVGRELHEPVLLRMNGALQIEEAPSTACDLRGRPSAQDAFVTPVTAVRRRRPTRAIRLSPERWERLQTLRRKYGMTWDELADRIVELSEG